MTNLKILCWVLLPMFAITDFPLGETPFLLETAVQSSSDNESDKPRSDRNPGDQADSSPPDPVNQSSSTSIQKSEQSLSGEVEVGKGESRRNENVQFNLVDNNALKEHNKRMGITATIIKDFTINHGYFGTEFGNSPTPTIHVNPLTGSTIHGDFFWNHNNSVFSSRSFFQIGKVQPARDNRYGFNLMLPIRHDIFLSFRGSQNKLQGNVNGNIFIPLPEEREPLTDDPSLIPIIQNMLNAYPTGPPNRQDISKRSHNTNSLQRINIDVTSTQLDHEINDQDRLLLRHDLIIQNIDAFQLVTGRNPNTDNRNHRARVTWIRNWTTNTVTEFSLGFDRLKSLLRPTADAIGPVYFAKVLTALGPSPVIPIDRVMNHFHYSAQGQHNFTNHTITVGFSLTRLQYNSEETDSHRGVLLFQYDFGRDPISNLRLGKPSYFWKSFGNTYRGFRNFQSAYYISDRWRTTKSLSLNFGLRFVPLTRPTDVTGLSNLPFKSDLNNWGPRFGLAYWLPGRWGILRSGYALLYGTIFPATFSQDRFNPPHSFKIGVPVPDLTNPSGNLSERNIDPNTLSGWSEISPDLSTPYSHHYNLSWELNLNSNWHLKLGYVGSRSHKLFLTHFNNRARYVEGIPFNTSTINLRRPDPTRLEHLIIHNGSRAYFDATRISLRIPQWNSLTLNTSYWYSKALDIGTTYTNNGSQFDSRRGVTQTAGDPQLDNKGLSYFDQRHAFLLQFLYKTPNNSNMDYRMTKIFGSWNFSAVTLFKSGTPFSVSTGSDTPGFGNGDGRSNDRPMLIQPSVLGRTISDPNTSRQLLPRSAFQFINAPEQMSGDLGRNTFRRGPIANVNAALFRTWRLLNNWNITFRAEVINLTNTPQFDNPERSLTNDNFAQITNTLNDGRNIRFQIRLSF